MWESGRSPISAAKISQLGCMAPVRERGGVSLSFANDVSEHSLDFAALQYGVGGLPIMRRANAQLGSIRRAAIVVAQCGCVRARPTKIDAPVVPLVSENSR
jgi:hypothetical protein